jgi:hypothetical protein
MIPAMIQPTLTLSFLFPGGVGDFTVAYGTNLSAPVPTIGEPVGSHAGTAAKVTARTWNYDAVGALTVTITCG